MIEIRTLKGPLADEHLGWLTKLYGPVDAKYASLDFVRYQFNDNPFGWSAHAFAVDGDMPVAHSAAVPFRARRGDDDLVAGKIEAVVVAPEYRGQRLASGESIAIGTLQAMYAFAHECGIPVLFGLAPPRVTAIHVRAGCRRVEVTAPTYVLFTRPRLAAREWSLPRRVAASVVGAAQNALVAGVSTFVRIAMPSSARAVVGAPHAEDADLAKAPNTPDTWTISGADAWDWYRGNGLLRHVELDGHGRRSVRALVLAPEYGAVQVVAWRPGERNSFAAAILLIAAMWQLARARGAPTLRFQGWDGDGGNGSLTHACRMLGFTRRSTAELVVHAEDEDLAELPIRLTPFFYVTF